MPFALSDGEENVATIIESQGIRHRIRLSVDAVRQVPAISHEEERCARTTGTSITVEWPVSASSKLDAARCQFLQLVDGFALLNPHATIRLAWDGATTARPALDPNWRKWGPSDPTSAYWYDPPRFERLVAAYANENGARPVREFVTEFRGLSGSAKVSAVLAGDRPRAHHPRRSVRRQWQTRSAHPPPAARNAGAIEPGEARRPRRDRARELLGPLPCNTEPSFDSDDYKRRLILGEDGVPTVIEVAFAYAPHSIGACC